MFNYPVWLLNSHFQMLSHYPSTIVIKIVTEIVHILFIDQVL